MIPVLLIFYNFFRAILTNFDLSFGGIGGGGRSRVAGKAGEAEGNLGNDGGGVGAGGKLKLREKLNHFLTAKNGISPLSQSSMVQKIIFRTKL